MGDTIIIRWCKDIHGMVEEKCCLTCDKKEDCYEPEITEMPLEPNGRWPCR